MQKIPRQHWGFNQKLSRWMYTALIRPILSYGNTVWLPALDYKSNVDKLTRVQRQGCLATLRAMSSTPTAGMEVILNLQPIEIHLKSIAINSYIRMKKKGTWRTVPGQINRKLAHSNVLKALANKIQNIEMETDKLQHKAYVKKNFNIRINNRDDIKKITPRPENVNIIHCFIDGSKNDNSSG